MKERDSAKVTEWLMRDQVEKQRRALVDFITNKFSVDFKKASTLVDNILERLRVEKGVEVLQKPESWKWLFDVYEALPADAIKRKEKIARDRRRSFQENLAGVTLGSSVKKTIVDKDLVDDLASAVISFTTESGEEDELSEKTELAPAFLNLLKDRIGIHIDDVHELELDIDMNQILVLDTEIVGLLATRLSPTASRDELVILINHYIEKTQEGLGDKYGDLSEVERYKAILSEIKNDIVGKELKEKTSDPPYSPFDTTDLGESN